jgi:hypothetical protein
MLSLVALIFMALAVGGILFQIINKSIYDPFDMESGRYYSSVFKMGIAAILVAAPIFYLATIQIFKNMISGVLDDESGVRKWLTYLLLFASLIVMIVWMITTIFNI